MGGVRGRKLKLNMQVKYKSMSFHTAQTVMTRLLNSSYTIVRYLYKKHTQTSTKSDLYTTNTLSVVRGGVSVIIQVMNTWVSVKLK